MQADKLHNNETKEQLRRDGIPGPLQLADLSQLDEIREEISKLKAARRAQLQKIRDSGGSLESVVNPLIDRHMDIEPIRSLFFDANFQAATEELFGTDLFVWRTNYFVKSDGTG